MRCLTRISTIACMCFLWTAGIAGAATLVVQQDGSGDYLNIAAALAAAQPGDLIQVGTGVYTELLTIGVTDLTIESISGPAATVLDGLNAHRILLVSGPYAVTLRGLTFTNGLSSGEGGFGSGILAWNGPTLVIEDCVFVGNTAGWDNAAIHVRHTGTTVTCTNCVFEDNSAEHNGGACGVMYGAVLMMEHCVFRENNTPGQAGACNAFDGGHLSIQHSLFVRNRGLIGAVGICSASANISHNTFHANQSLEHASIMFYIGASGTFNQNIVSNDGVGAGLKISSSTCLHNCNVYFDNAAGHIVGSGFGHGEVVAEPLFCDANGDDFTLCADSPALADNNGCGVLIGAYGEGCGPCGGVIAVEHHTWTGVKARFR